MHHSWHRSAVLDCYDGRHSGGEHPRDETPEGRMGARTREERMGAQMRSKYRHRLLMRRFHDSICNVLYDANDLSEYEIDRILGLNGVSLKKRVMHDLLGVLIDIHFELGDNNINAHNRDIGHCR